MKNEFMKLKKRVFFLFCMLFCSIVMMAQNAITVKGIVKDETGEPVIGANISLKNNKAIGTIADINGNFELKVPSTEAILSVSFIGMLSQDVKVSLNPMIITLKTDNVQLDEVVVIGYGEVKKRDLTGAITQVDSEKLMASAPTTIQDALRGKAAGVMVATNSGINDTPMIRIRGNRSINASNDPLFVIDGIPSTGGMESINPNDVVSMEILKDASATAIYGARGANGVIMVTTKKGETGKVNVEYNGYISIGQVARETDNAMNAAQFAEYVREANRTYIYDGQGGWEIDPNCTYPSMEPKWELDQTLEPFTRDPSGYTMESLKRGWVNGVYDPSKLRDFNWTRIGRNTPTISHNHSVSIRGGSEMTKVYISGNFMDLEGLSNSERRKRYALRMNLEQKLGDRIIMGANTSFSYIDYTEGKHVWNIWNPLASAYYSPGGSGQYGIGGDVTQDGDPKLGVIPSPAGETLYYSQILNFDNEKYTKRHKRNRLDATLYATIKLYDGLTYRANFGTDLYVVQDLTFESSKSGENYGKQAQTEQKRPIDRGWTFENILNYSKTFGQHSLNITAVQSSQKWMSEDLTATGLGIPIESQMWNSLQTSIQQSASSKFKQWTMMSWMGRVIYGFLDNRYMLTASLRYDGSSRLADGHKWVAFPSASLAWRISDEPFMRNINFLSNLKLRVGYGKTGNSAVEPYSTIGKISSSRYNFGEMGMMGYAPSSLANNSLTWETTGQYNIGLDFGFFKNRINGSIELYKQNTEDLLMTRSLPSVSGFGSIMQNIGETENKGLEISLETINIQTKDFQWSSNIQFAINKEKIVKLATGETSDIANNWFVGHPVDSYYNYVKTDYVWGCSKEDMDEMAKFNANGHNFKPGDYRVKDLNGDYKITAEDDRAILGQRMPKWSFGFSNTLNYKNFDFYVFATGMFGHTIYRGNDWGSAPGRGGGVYQSYWTPLNTKTAYRKPIHNNTEAFQDVAYKYHKGDFVRISDISLGYTLPVSIIKHVGMERARFYVQVQNPFLITKYPGNNPEGFVSATRSGTSYNEASNSIGMRNYLLGVNLTF